MVVRSGLRVLAYFEFPGLLKQSVRPMENLADRPTAQPLLEGGRTWVNR
jgi:hypothetical protein